MRDGDEGRKKDSLQEEAMMSTNNRLSAAILQLSV